MDTRSPLGWRVLALLTAVALAIGFLGLASSMSGGMVIPPVWMAVCAIIMLLVIVLPIFAISTLAGIGSSGRR